MSQYGDLLCDCCIEACSLIKIVGIASHIMETVRLQNFVEAFSLGGKRMYGC